MNQQHKRTKGFTLVELMLAMAFIGALLLTIAITTIHIMGTYTKGLTVREVNQAGRTISEDIQRTIAASIPFTINGGADSQYIVRDGGGRLCTGAYTYAWNYGKTTELGGGDSTRIYNTYNDSGDELIRLVKVSDAGGALCADPEAQISKAQSEELLSAGDRNLAVQALTVRSGARSDVSGQAIYAITLVLGTNNNNDPKGSTILNPSHTACLPPKDESQTGNENFCAINQFDILARAGNRSGSL